MGKVTKNVVKSAVAVLSALVVLAVTLPLAATLLVSLPAVQNAIVQRFMKVASHRLGTRVSIDRIEVKLINRVVVEGFYVEDFGGDTLLYSKKVTAPVTELGLGGGMLTFGRVALDSTKLWIKRDSLGNINIQQVVQALRGEGSSGDSKFRMRINGVEAPDITFGLLRGDRPFREGVDFSRFVIRNTAVSLDYLTVSADTVQMGIKSLSFSERSGFCVDNLSARELAVSEGKVLLSDVKLRAHGADLDLSHVNLTADSWEEYSEFINRVDLAVGVRPSRVTASLVGWFVPAVADWRLALDDVALATQGTVAAMSGEIANIRALTTTLAGSFQSRGMPDFGNMWVDASLSELRTSGADVDSLLRSIGQKPLPAALKTPLLRAGRANLVGRFAGTPADFTATATLATEAGDVASTVTVEQGSDFDAQTETANLDAGKLFDVPQLGLTALSLAMKGSFDHDRRLTGDVDGVVRKLIYKGYDYHDVTLAGRLDRSMFDGEVHSPDPNMRLDFMGMIDLGGEIPHYNFDLDVGRADLAATGLFARDSVAVLSGKVVASGSGDNLDNLNGRLEAREVSYISPSDTLHTPLARLTGHNTATRKELSLSSDFVDGRFLSRLSYRDMLDYLKVFLRDYIPLLYDEVPVQPPLNIGSGEAPATAYSILNVRAKDTERLLAILLPGAQLATGSELSFVFNPFVRSFSLSAHSDYLEYRGMLATDVELNSDNTADSLTFHLTSDNFYRGTLKLPQLGVHGGARGRQMTLSTRLANGAENFSALVGLRITSGEDGRVAFGFTPSHVTLENRTWLVDARSIVLDRQKLSVDGFRVYSQDAATTQLSASGVVSRHQSDTLHVGLNRFDLAPLSRLVEGAGYHARGKATGYVDFVSMLRGTRILSGIDLEDVALNGTAVTPTRFTSFWDRDRMRFQMLNQRTNVNVLRGTLTPTTGEISATARLDGVELSLLDPLLKNAIEGTLGTANARLSLGGTLGNLNVNGAIDVPHIETTVSFTRARYTLENGVIAVDNSRLALPPTTLTDPLGNTGELSLGVDLSNFRNVGFELEGSVRNLLAMNTTSEDNEAYYGQVFATGGVAINGNRMGTRINISVATTPGSKFYLPLSAKSNIAWADFVTFAGQGTRGDEPDVSARKRELYEQRLKGAGANKPKIPIELDMTINLTPDAAFNMMIDPLLGNGISAFGQGVMNLRINPATNLFSMVGDVAITSGKFEFSMMELFTRDFAITPGSTLVWTGEPTDAVLNVEGTYRVRTSLVSLLGQDVGAVRSVPVECLLGLSGRLSNPGITFDVKAPTLDIETRARIENAMNTQELKSMQFLSLLTMGSFVPESSLGQAGSAGSMTNGGVGFDFLTNQLGNMLSNDDYNVYLRYTPQNEYTGPAGEFDVGFSKGFIDNRLILEIEGNYVDDRAANTTGTGDVSNLAGDVYLTWVIDRSGNLRLKVFTQTIDRLDENQGLQEGGVGIYYKKDFDSWREVWRKKRDRITTFDQNNN
ncbi:MAG: translocation/assembly module TamB [Rikenellaceae bacterium]|jgi:hypothetical protein|nr:translocation/assembly module TamB [Rikenellaceae bacterium]